MTFKRAIGPPTAEQQERQDKCREMMCVACSMQQGWLCAPQEIHHLTQSGRQLGQDYTICLCCWHHRGVPAGYEMFGPSLAHGSKKFHARYGSNDELLAYQNNLIGWTKPPLRRSRERKRGSDKIVARKL